MALGHCLVMIISKCDLFVLLNLLFSDVNSQKLRVLIIYINIVMVFEILRVKD